VEGFKELKQVPKHKTVTVPHLGHSGEKSRYCFNEFTANKSHWPLGRLKCQKHLIKA
jgi:hypothetical protein